MRSRKKKKNPVPPFIRVRRKKRPKNRGKNKEKKKERKLRPSVTRDSSASRRQSTIRMRCLCLPWTQPRGKQKPSRYGFLRVSQSWMSISNRFPDTCGATLRTISASYADYHNRLGFFYLFIFFFQDLTRFFFIHVVERVSVNSE